MPKLVHTVEGTAFREYTLMSGSLRIGRNGDNDIQLNDDAVSGRHAELSVRPSAYMEGYMEVWAKDLDSTNGTLVNGKRIREHLPKHDDVIKIGTNEFKFVEDSIAALQRTRVLLDDN